VDIEIDEPWAGSTERGFGQRSYFSLTRAGAKELAAWLNDILKP